MSLSTFFHKYMSSDGFITMLMRRSGHKSCGSKSVNTVCFINIEVSVFCSEGNLSSWHATTIINSTSFQTGSISFGVDVNALKLSWIFRLRFKKCVVVVVSAICWILRKNSCQFGSKWKLKENIEFPFYLHGFIHTRANALAILERFSIWTNLKYIIFRYYK